MMAVSHGEVTSSLDPRKWGPESVKILFLSRWFPYPPDNGSKIRIFHLLEGLSSQHEIHLVSFAGKAREERDLSALRSICRSVVAVPFRPFLPTGWKGLLGLFSWTPRSVKATHSERMEQEIAALMRQEDFDLVIASELGTAPYAAPLSVPAKILEDVEMGLFWEQYARQRSPLLRCRYGLTWWKARRHVGRLLQSFQGCTVVSEQDRALLERSCRPQVPIEVVPNGIAPSSGEKAVEKEERTLVFPGSLTYEANYDAIRFFLSQVFPLIRKRVPEVCLKVTGSTEGVDLDVLEAEEGVVFTGHVPEIRPLVANCAVCVVPLRKGSGTRLKILEAMAVGTAVVSTSKGAEGLPFKDGEELLVRDRPEGFAEAVVECLTNPRGRRDIERKARSAVEREHTWLKSVQRLNAFLLSVAGQEKERVA